jgi:hypothetical protein
MGKDRVFFSFDYENDLNRALTVTDAFTPTSIAGFTDITIFKNLCEDEQVLNRWINRQLEGTELTVVLIGSSTFYLSYIQYAIEKSLRQGNALLGLYIHRIKDLYSHQGTAKGNAHVFVGSYEDDTMDFFDEICDGLYDYVSMDGKQNLEDWISLAKRKHKRNFY